ncbi:MAG: type II toxin-antitoxin system RelE/ParE family toxin [Pyrinomonadaceae bacterium]
MDAASSRRFQAIYDFIGRDSPHYAQVIVEDILAAIDRLERFPLMGRHVPERPREDLRELIKPPYRIVYRAGEVIRILTIFRASRLIPSGLK